jgi:nuclear transcription Y subunit beta
LNEKRKTINGEDILTYLKGLGFDNYEGVLKVYLAKYRDVRCRYVYPAETPQHQMNQSRHKQQPRESDEDDKKEGEETAQSKKRGVKRKTSLSHSFSRDGTASIE